MALTEDQLNQVEFNDAQQKVHRKMELVRIAKETLLENDRSKSADERGVTASDITTFADALNTYVNQ
jgi:hypothetical protein